MVSRFHILNTCRHFEYHLTYTFIFLDLDVETLRALEEALLNFAGCAIVVSHDRYFLDRTATHILACEGDSKWHYFEGNYSEYEDNRVKRLGQSSIKRIKYAPLLNA